MKLCLYARQYCKWPDKGCPKEELRPLFAEDPEPAVHEVWGCQCAGRRVPSSAYLMQLVQEGKIK